MKIKSLTGAPPFGAMFGPASGLSATMTSPLIMSAHPTAPLQAATKGYVDTAVTSVSADKVIAGTLSLLRMPLFTGGDVTSNPTTKAIALNAVNRVSVPGQSVAGEFSKISVNVKGIVEDSAALLASDIPSLSWGKLKSGLPTTTAGYGITDALGKTGGILSNFLSLANAPVANLNAANKQYADDKVNSSPKYATGDVMRLTATVSPTGFLRANGGELSKSTYSALYAVVGDKFNVNSQPGNGRPWVNQFEINTAMDLPLVWGSHSSFSYYPGAKTGVVLKDKVYLTFVNNSRTMGYSNAIDANGGISATWNSSTILNMPPGTRLYAGYAVIRNRLHMVGGYDNAGLYLTDSYSAPINTDGTIGTWVKGPSIPVGLQNVALVYTKDRLYSLGGSNADGNASVIYTTIVNSDGTLAGWSEVAALPVPMYNFSTAVVRNRLYLIGGYTSTGYTNSVYYADIGSNGLLGGWTKGNDLPVNSATNEIFVTKKRLYLFVGYNGNSTINSVYSCPVYLDGSIGTWSLDGNLPNGLLNPFVFGTSSKVYIIGATTNNAYVCYAAAIIGSPNDYSPYYDGTVAPTSATAFRLPDYSDKEVNGLRYFVKT